MSTYEAKLGCTTYTMQVPENGNVFIKRNNPTHGDRSIYIPRELLLKAAIDLVGAELRKKLLQRW